MGSALLSRATLILLLLIGRGVQAEVEYGIEFSTRSYPLGGLLTASLGYGLEVWGASGPDQIFYGYIKPELKLSTIGTYNSGSALIKIFPISFLGLVVGAEALHNSRDYPDYNCELYRCVGKAWQTYVEGQLALAVGPIFTVLRAGLEDWHQDPRQDRDFINSSYGLALQQQGDRVRFAGGALGYKFNSEWMMLYSYMWLQTHEREGQSQTHMGLVQWATGAWKIMVGGGSFDSELKNKGATAVLRIEWGSPSLELF